MTAFDACGHCRSHSQRTMRLAEIVIREVERDRSLKISKLLAESIGQPCESAAVHPGRRIECQDACARIRRWGSVDHRSVWRTIWSPGNVSGGFLSQQRILGRRGASHEPATAKNVVAPTAGQITEQPPWVRAEKFVDQTRA